MILANRLLKKKSNSARCLRKNTFLCQRFLCYCDILRATHTHTHTLLQQICDHLIDLFTLHCDR